MIVGGNRFCSIRVIPGLTDISAAFLIMISVGAHSLGGWFSIVDFFVTHQTMCLQQHQVYSENSDRLYSLVEFVTSPITSQTKLHRLRCCRCNRKYKVLIEFQSLGFVRSGDGTEGTFSDAWGDPSNTEQP